MDGPFLSPPAKRSFYSVSGIHESNTYSSVNGAPKRGRGSKHVPPPIIVSPGQVVLRLLCHVSMIGGVIGKSGNVIKQFQQETGSKIRVEDPVVACDERIIIVVASENPKKKIKLKDDKGEESVKEYEVSPAQEALVKVFDRILDVEAETEGVFPPGGGIVSCRLLAASNQVGSVMGKGGKIIGGIRKDSRAKISVLPTEQLPACASPNDDVIEITGNILAVKKALVAVSCRLQACPPTEKAQSIASRPETTHHGSFPDPHGEFPRPRSSLFTHTSNSSIDYPSRGRPLSTDVDRIPTLDPEKTQQEVLFRLLCTNDKIGGIIGKGGIIVRALQNETGASISCGASVAESDERVITVSAMENPESRYSPAQNALLRVFTRLVEAGMEKGLESEDSVAARLLVPSNQAGCLLGKGGQIISEMRKVTGAGIRIIGGDQVPKCASENDEVVQIIGEFRNVQDGLLLVSGRLRDNLFPTELSQSSVVGSYSSAIPEISPYGRVREPTPPRMYPSVALSHNIDRKSSLTHSIDHLGLSHSLDRPPSPRLWTSQTVGGGNPRGFTDIGKGLTTYRGGIDLGSGSKSAIVTNTTVEIAVPEDALIYVYGQKGNNLSRLRQISGAKVIVHDPRPGTSNGMVFISGTPEQTQTAQSLLQAFILNGQSSPDRRSQLF
ncbi:KH domain-containing protein HEN4-like isoform X2 [Macadamia integrifolia]|uniref:KH domain-containing protein HEN4-like isoform X2 n=1 Tax=Macadamia integrifolia TaxID=60698 RepID=UPI001C4F1FA2|nr:KH domain-containing protein HEN4-like isoform X2 [Macadamia integrifolia]